MNDKKSHWQNIYKDKSPLEVSWFQNKPTISMEFIHNTGISLRDPIIATFSFDGPKQCSGLDIVQYDSEKIKKTLGSSFELIEEKAEIHITPADKEQSFNYFRFIHKP
jgi:hypothetical protein